VYLYDLSTKILDIVLSIDNTSPTFVAAFVIFIECCKPTISSEMGPVDVSIDKLISPGEISFAANIL
jgi:hypothetical protein